MSGLAKVAQSAKSFITTPIFYVNAAPHIGHLYSMILADTTHRYSLFKGMRSIMCTGTDEHGTKVSRASEKAKVPTKQFVDSLSLEFKKLADTAHIDYCRFVRTTDQDHTQEATKLWEILKSKNMIYRSKHTGWYCVSDETFYPESELETDPETGVKLSKESKNQVEWYEEENWFFRLSEMQDKLIEFYRKHTDFVQPENRHNALLQELLTAPLTDLSISRPIDRCSWGIPVPGSDQTMYVWFEALVNYMTVAKSQSHNKEDLSEWWPATHIIGKDIIRFHAIYWPAFLLAAGIEPPKHVVVHSHWLVEGSKMSKSKKNVIDPFEMISRFGLDTVRYTLCYDSALAHDSPFSYDRVTERHNVNLVNKWVNLASRICGPKFDIPKSLSLLKEQGNPALAETVASLRETCDKRAGAFEFGKYARTLNDFAIAANGALEEAAPWYEPQSEKSMIAIANAAESCRVLTLMLLPIIPEYAHRMLDRVGVSKTKRTYEFAQFGADLDYGVGANRKGDHVLQRL